MFVGEAIFLVLFLGAMVSILVARSHIPDL